jgi:8-amino-7-oxononanoate synthase
MFDPLAWLDDELTAWQSRGLMRQLAERGGSQSPQAIQFGGQKLVNFGSNDYLGLAADSRLVSAAKAAIEQVGWGAGASPLVTGRGRFHAELERQLADFEGVQAALLFPSGFAANVGTITSLVRAGDAIFSDAKNHASLIDGCRLSSARIVIYRHGDVDHLRGLLASSLQFRRKLIVTDSVFSMDGDLAPLSAIVETAADFKAMVLVDEAHATGVFGAQGRGLCEQLGVEDGVHIRVGTLSKALGSAGGFVAGDQRLIDWLANRARPYVFSTAQPEAQAAAAIEALAIVRAEPQRRAELLAKAERLRVMLAAQKLSPRGMSQIVPVVIGDPARTMAVANALRARGYFVPGIRPPSVPQGESLLRISVSSVHDEAALEGLANAIGQLVHEHELVGG